MKIYVTNFFVLGILLCQKAKNHVGSGPGNFKKKGNGLSGENRVNANKKLLNFLIPLSYNADKFGLKQ